MRERVLAAVVSALASASVALLVVLALRTGGWAALGLGVACAPLVILATVAWHFAANLGNDDSGAP